MRGRDVVDHHLGSLPVTGLDKEGIYRIPALLPNLNALRFKIEQDENIDIETPSSAVPEADDINCVAGLLKMYLRELPVPLLPINERDRMDYASEFALEALSSIPLGLFLYVYVGIVELPDPNVRVGRLKEYVRHSKESSRETLYAVIEHMKR